ncbi:uncharacterized protein L3040_008370 [Drepanopeziza brunnea f. sp. 'multigermtubi']|uniref:Integral membrane protein n=1 Tax=Marssonina brunnea f. sp. multigermtubi (strain MB_m1) TaxID=1072389 RepID=K1WN27_MARBU|nr:uncharacterized protein MBM_07511 [Drepanopeziza brunnea f. sp. 'multigermtubi' MB_m1]EKD14281.1 integral membrane protein [Drepanopeziza brunnea f. sp. 'multigermtubi' MB_m1]KAJ5035109.1 hypothetical protein L3040_008370 [Drepanopeziza brunnea f. sp. 'multigermtubi']
MTYAPTAQGWRMIIIVSVLVLLSTIAVGLRLYARLKLGVPLLIDDHLCFVAMFLMYGMLIQLVLWCTIGGNGSYIEDLTPYEITNFFKIFLANQFTYFFLSPTIKISIVCFFQRIFSVSQKFHYVAISVNCLIAVWGAGIVFTCGLQCRPIRAFWDRSIDGNCIPVNTFVITNQVFNVIMDFVLLALPLPLIWNLRRSWQEKLALTGIFALGGFVCFASVYRIASLLIIVPAQITNTVYQATLWTHIEPSVGIICACLPTIRGLFSWRRMGDQSENSTDAVSYAKGSKPGLSSTDTKSEYIRMADTNQYRAGETDEESLVRHAEEDSKITVRTDIEITNDGSKTPKSHLAHMSVQQLKL